MGRYRVSWAALAGGAALLGEGYALFALAHGDSPAAAAWHAGACAVLVVLAGRGPCEWSERCQRQLVAAALAACLPGVGVVGVAFVLLPLWRRTAATEPRAIVEREPAEPRDACRESAALAELLLDARTRPLEPSMRRLRALRCLPLMAALPHWRAALRQPHDELRLLAHALIAQREREHQAAIERAQRRLTSVAPDRERWSALRALAFAHWELLCSERLPAESREHTLAAAGECARAALAIQAEAQLCLLLARVCLRQADGLSASHWLQRAGCLGVPTSCRALLHAEAAFLQRRFEQIPHWLRQVGDQDARCKRLKALWLRAARN